MKIKIFLALIFTIFVSANCKKPVKNGTPPKEKFYHFSYTPEKKVKNVYVAGDFNSWKTNHQDFKMKKQNDKFVLKINQKKLSKGKNLYVFVVDGEYVIDPKAKETENRGIGGKVGVFYLNHTSSK